MALSARELFLIVRAQNQASGTLRRVSADMASLGRKEALSAHRAQLGLQRQKLLNTGQRITNQLAKEEFGSSAIGRQRAQQALDLKRSKLGDTINKGMAQRLSLQKQLYDADTRGQRLDERKYKIQRALGDIGQNARRFKDAKAAAIAAGNADAYIEADRGAKALSRTSRDLGKQLGFTNRDIESNIKSIRGLNGAYSQLRGGIRNNVQALRNTNTEQEQLNARSAESSLKQAELRRNLTANVEALAQNTEKFKQLAQAEKAIKMERIGQATHLLGSMGRQLQLVGFGGAAALGFAANAAANLSSSVTLATTQYKNNVQQIKSASDVNFGFVLKQMREFPSAAEDMSKSLYDIFSTLNVNGRQGRDILEQVNKAAVAGQISTQEATSGVLSVLSNFKEIAQTGKGTEGALNRMFAAVRYGRVTMAEFSASLQTTAPAANQTGQSFDNLAGSVAFLSRSLGISKASVGYARLLQQLTSTAMVSGLKQHGIAVRDASGHYKQLDQILGAIVQKFPKLTTGQLSAQNFFKSISGTTGTIQGARAMTTLVTNMSGYRDILNKTDNDQNEFKKSFDALNQTAGVQFAKALNVLKSLWLELGRAAIPTIAKLLSPIGELADKLSHMDQATKDSIGRFLALGVAITGVTGVVLSVVSALGGAALILSSLGGPLLLGIAAGFIAIGAAIYLIITNWDKIGPRLQSALPALQNAVVAAVGGIQNILEKVSGLVASFVGIVDALIRGDWGDLWNSAGEAVGHFGDLVTIALRGVGAGITSWVSLATSSVQGWIAAMAIFSFTAIKAATAIKELATAYKLIAEGQVASKVAAGGGLATSLGAGVGKLMSDIKGLVAIFKELRGQGVGTFAALGQMAAQLGASLGPAGPIIIGIAAVTGGLLLLNKAWQGSEVNRFIMGQHQMVEAANQATSSVKSETDALKGLANAANSFQTARLDKAQANLDVITSRRAYQQAVKDAHANGTVTRDERLNLRQLRIDWDRARESAQQAGVRFKASADQLTALRGRASGALKDTPDNLAQQLQGLEARRAVLQKYIAQGSTGLTVGGAQNAQQATAALKQINEQIATAVQNSSQLQVARGAIVDYIKALDPGASAAKIQAVTDKMLALGKVFTPKQIKMALNSKDIDVAAKKIRNANQDLTNISKHHATIKINVETKGLSAAAQSAQKVFQHHAQGPGNAATLTANPAPAIQAAKKAGDAIDKVGRKVVHPKINAQFKPDSGAIAGQATTLGAAAKSGVLAGASGLGDQLGAQMAGDVTRAIAQAKAAAESKSPSKKTQREIGLPLAQGIIKGFSDEMKKNWGKTAKSVQRLIMKGLDLTGSAKEKGKAIADAFKQAMDTAVQTLTDKWTEIHDLNQQNFGELFQSDTIQAKVDWGAALSIGDLQTDLNKQLRTFRTFNASLTRLQRRGGPKTLIDQLRQLGPSAQGELDALNGATKSELKKYERTWQASQRAINQATKQQFKQQIKDWKSQGQAIAAGILMGLRSEQGGLERYFKRVWQNMISVTRKHNKSHSPSLLYAQEGVNIIEGLRMGMERASTGLAVPMPGVGLGGGRRGSQGGPQTVIYQTVNAHHSESLDTTLRKASFRLKHRNR